MRKFHFFLILHLIVLHISMAGMEFVSWLLFTVCAVDMIRKKQMPLWKGAGPWILGFVLIATAGILASVEPLKLAGFHIGFLRWPFLLYSFAYAWSQSEFLNKPERLIWIWYGIAAIAGGYAFFQFFTGIDFVRPHRALDPAGRHGFRANGFFSMALTLAYVLGISASFLLPWLKERKYFWLRLGLMALICFGMFASLSRGAWLAFAIVLFIYGAMEQGKKVLWWLLPALGVFALLFTFEPEFRYRITSLVDFNSRGSSGMRADIWRAYWQMFLEHPFFGVGLFSGDKLLLGYYSQLGIVQEFVSHAHNNYLQVLAGTGSFGFICFFAFNFYFLVEAFRLKARLSGDLQKLAFGVFLAQIFWQIGGLTQCNFFDGEVNHSIVFGWALVLALRAHLESQFSRALKS